MIHAIEVSCLLLMVIVCIHVPVVPVHVSFVDATAVWPSVRHASELWQCIEVYPHGYSLSMVADLLYGCCYHEAYFKKNRKVDRCNNWSFDNWKMGEFKGWKFIVCNMCANEWKNRTCSIKKSYNGETTVKVVRKVSVNSGKCKAEAG